MTLTITTGPYPGHYGAAIAHYNYYYIHSHYLQYYHPNNNHKHNYMTGHIQQPIPTWSPPNVILPQLGSYLIQNKLSFLLSSIR
ncbi:hypothetical protein [Bacillus sp. EB600]|uniref:hypothetical protein n=1 Tax=Bacillus sp. EB600 TaxID=2806345 RepID=UPI00210DB0D7|nr:hypothetical protein [Bacillus sp. EB600]MCQ6281975.1 hypothetical protein [Bacillus sp. EB600]